LDPGSFEELDGDLRASDPLEFVDVKPYVNRIVTAESAGKSEAVVTAAGRLDGIEITIAAMDFSFIGGSMGSVVGEKIARACRLALQRSVPFIIVSQSGGARMQEGIYSLMQMAKTSTVLARLHEASLPFISVLTNPTTGGTTASHSMLGDVNLAEPNALIGFTGPRVIEETIKQKLPKGFQRSEFQLEHGMIDLVVDRRDLKETIAVILRHQRAGWTE
jgi:acetyl-CoA carboxylase carboxyl transferase subunit beta